MIIRTASLLDINDIINIHIESLPKGIQTYMGLSFLRQKYYFLIMFSEVKLVCEINGEVVGFSLSSPKSEFKLKLKLKHFLKISLNLIKNISIVLKLFYGRFLLFITKDSISNKDKLNVNNIELGYISISKSKRSMCIGTLLIDEFENTAKNEFNYTKIKTRTHNERLTNFYLLNKNATIQKQKSSGHNYTCTLIWNIK